MPVPSYRLLSIAALLLVSIATANAQPATPLTLGQIMADPEWIGPPVEDAWWSWDGQHAQYTLKRDGGSIRDTFQQSIDGGIAVKLDGAARADLDAAQPVFDAQRARMAFVRNGDVFVRDLRNGALTQLTRTDADEARPQWSRDGGLVWRDGNDWYRWSGGSVTQAALI
ncbi:MAG: S9 family peptidase, partial [Luteimonas sp.]